MLRGRIQVPYNWYNLLFHRNYLSNQYKSLVVDQINEIKLEKYKLANNHATAVSVDLLAHRLETDDSKNQALDQLQKIRCTNEATKLLNSTSFAIVKYFIDTNAINDLLTILSNRLEYGVFIDEFTGCYIMDSFLNNKQFYEAAQIAVEHMIQEDFDHKLVAALSMKACYEFFRSAETEPEKEPEIVPESENKEKVRVKFVRNIDESNFEKFSSKPTLIGRTCIALSKTCDKNISMNMLIIGYLLTKQFDEMAKVLKNENAPIYDDVFNECLKYMERNVLDNNIINDTQKILKNNTCDGNFGNHLELLIEDARGVCEKEMIVKQKAKFAEFNQAREKLLLSDTENANRMKRIENSEQILNDINKRQNLLWFFNNEDQINLKIFSKKIIYPKRWFGKKKKPKHIDENYIPPDIRKN